MLLNFVVTITVSLNTPPPPEHVQHLVEQIRYPRTMGADELRKPQGMPPSATPKVSG